MKNNESGVVRSIEGGRQATERLAALGIRPGKVLKKISSHFWKGPVTVMLDKNRIAIGHGMAHKIILETEENE
jgi:ferrous iron transport protein A